MKFLGKILPKKGKEKFHAVEIPELGIFTQGKNYNDCLRMAQEAMELLLEVEVQVGKFGKNSFWVTSNDLKPLVGRFLETLREQSGLSIREVTERLGKKSPNFYAQYEQGRSLPSMEMVTNFVKAMDPELDIVISLEKVS